MTVYKQTLFNCLLIARVYERSIMAIESFKIRTLALCGSLIR